MEPIIKVDKRLVTTDMQVFYCSLCGAELFSTGGIFHKPFWQRKKYAWYLGPLHGWIEVWEWIKTLGLNRWWVLLLLLGMFSIWTLIQLS